MEESLTTLCSIFANSAMVCNYDYRSSSTPVSEPLWKGKWSFDQEISLTCQDLKSGEFWWIPINLLVIKLQEQKYEGSTFTCCCCVSITLLTDRGKFISTSSLAERCYSWFAKSQFLNHFIDFTFILFQKCSQYMEFG